MKRTIGIIALAALLLTALVPLGAMAEQDIRVQVDGELVEMDVVPVIEDDRTLVPLRGVLERLGAIVEWNEDERAVEVLADNIAILLIVGQDTATVTRKGDVETATETIPIDVPARIIGDRTFVPARFIAETLGAGVEWDAPNRTVVIESVGGLQGIRDVPAADGDAEPVEGEIRGSMEEMGDAIPVDEIEKMVLYNLQGEEIGVFTEEETKELISALNTSPTYFGPHILMLAGNNIQITLKDGSQLSLTSFGSKEHVVVNGQVGDKNISYCVVAPQVGAILLSPAE